MRDNELYFSDDQALTSTQDSTNTIDLGAGIDHLNSATVLHTDILSKHSWLHILVTTTFAGGTSVAFALQDSTDNSSFAATNPAISVSAVAAATLVAQYPVLSVPLPPDLNRYLKIVYTIVGTFTAGKVAAWLGPPVKGAARTTTVKP